MHCKGWLTINKWKTFFVKRVIIYCCFHLFSAPVTNCWIILFMAKAFSRVRVRASKKSAGNWESTSQIVSNNFFKSIHTCRFTKHWILFGNWVFSSKLVQAAHNLSENSITYPRDPRMDPFDQKYNLLLYFFQLLKNQNINYSF